MEPKRRGPYRRGHTEGGTLPTVRPSWFPLSFSLPCLAWQPCGGAPARPPRTPAMWPAQQQQQQPQHPHHPCQPLYQLCFELHPSSYPLRFTCECTRAGMQGRAAGQRGRAGVGGVSAGPQPPALLPRSCQLLVESALSALVKGLYLQSSRQGAPPTATWPPRPGRCPPAVLAAEGLLGSPSGLVGGVQWAAWSHPSSRWTPRKLP